MSAQPRFTTGRCDATHDRRADLRIELAASEVVEKEQRLGALDHEVVHRHGDEIDADRGVARSLDRDLDLGADAIGRRDQDRVGKTGRFEVEKAAEAADLGVRPGRAVLRRSGLIKSTMRLPASISTPAAA